jgi:DNA-binding HxlR family transcriptional regulator
MDKRTKLPSEILTKRWTLSIIRVLLEGSHTFTEIVHCLQPISDPILSERLKELQQEGLVEREVTPQPPIRVRYSLTERGAALRTVVAAIDAWEAKREEI